MMGLGNCLTEEFLMDNGYVVTDHLARYRVPGIMLTPEITAIIVEHPNEAFRSFVEDILLNGGIGLLSLSADEMEIVVSASQRFAWILTMLINLQSQSEMT